MKSLTLVAISALAVGSLVASNAISADAPSETVVRIKVLVMLKDNAKDSPRPFPNVGRFVIRRAQDELKNASCPDLSNEKGELTCRLKCMKDDPDLRLQVVAPLKAQAPIVAGMSPPPAATLDIENCLIKKEPAAVQASTIQLTYRTPLAMAQEFRRDEPEVFAAVATTQGDTLTFKSLKQAAPALQQLAKTPANRAKLARLAALSEVYNEAVQSRKDVVLSPTLSEYASGAKSIVLQAAVADTMGPSANRLVTVSSSNAELHRSITNVAQELNQKPVLSSREIALARDVNAFQQNNGQRLETANKAASPPELERFLGIGVPAKN